MGRIVVGVDGSEGADAALAWAIGEARLRGARLEVVHSFTYPIMGDLPTVADADALFVQEAEAILERTVARSEVGDVEFDARVVRGSAAAVLLDAARDADLLVVGSRGRGGFAGLVLGSVSQQCAQHAPCPIVIVPSPRR